MTTPLFNPKSRLQSVFKIGRRHALAWLLPLALGCTAVSAQTELTGMARIRASGVLKVAVYKDNAPFSDGPTADMGGLDISIAEALAKQLKLKLVLLPFDSGENMNDDLRNMVWKGHYLGYGPADVMMHVPVDKYLMRENRQVLIFAPYMRQYQTLLHDTRTLPTVTGPDDLKGFKLAVERGTGNASVLLGHNEGMLRSDVNIYDTSTQAIVAVVDGKAAAAYVMRSQAEAVLSQVKSQPSHWALTTMPLSGLPDGGFPLGIAIKADAKELGQSIEQAFQTIRSSGELLVIFKQHGITLTAP